jgi:hypothetical protein
MRWTTKGGGKRGRVRGEAESGEEGNASALRLERRRDGRLWGVRGDEETPVKVRRLFPWSEQGPYLSLRDASNRELAVIGPTDAIDLGSAKLLDEADRAAGFVFEIARVLQVEDEIEIRVWRVETRQGPRVFQTRRDDWPLEIPGGQVLIRDVAGDLYLVTDPDALDRRSRDFLWAFVG